MDAPDTQEPAPTASDGGQIEDGPVVVVADGGLHPYHDFGYEISRWSGSGFRTRLEKCHSESDLITSARDANAIAFWGISVPFTRAVIGELSDCKLIIRYGTGIDSVDLEAAAECGILVGTPAGYCTEEVASHATALVLSLARRVAILDRHIRAGGWRENSPHTQGVQRMSEQTLGLVGFGRIARQVAMNLQPMFRRVVATDPYVDGSTAASLGVELMPLDRVLAASDFVSVHTPLTAATRHLIGASELASMKPTAFLVNTSRGAIIDDEAMVNALSSGSIAGAALDVFDTTPLPGDSPYRQLDNVILTPHFAANSERAKQELYAEVADMVEAVLTGGSPRGQMHLPPS